MENKFKTSDKFRLGTIPLMLALALGANAAEQASDEQGQEEEAKKGETIVITGSRIKRETYTSASPLQIITATESREVGLIDAADVLQNSSVASGQQIDLTFQGFVLDNGPGASTVSLRGLGEGRTLVLLNGRRLSPAGVEGAPTAPDLNLIPSGLVERYEILLDGASSVYGSDAVAGVTNIITRRDFDGFEISGTIMQPDHPNGEQQTIALTWGQNFDRGFVGVGLDYSNQEPVTLDDRPWTAGCEKHVEITTDGEIRHQDLWYQENLGQRTDPRGCLPTSGLVGRTIVSIFGSAPGSIYYTPGTSNGGFGNFSESTNPFTGNGIDTDGDGISDVSFTDYSLNGREQFAHLFAEQERISVMAYGEYTLEGEANVTPYFEVGYNKRDSFANSGAAQLFPFVPANNPFNLCNPNGVNGVDCGLAWDALMANPSVRADILATFGCDPAINCGVLLGPIGAIRTRPVVSVRGDRTLTSTEIEQTRVVLGTRGDLPALNFGSMSDWSWDTYIVHTKSKGTSSRPGIRDDRLQLSLNTTIEDPNNPGTYICGVDNDNDGIPDGTDGCVPVNMYAPSLYDPRVGDFATQAERDYLFDTRDFDTEYTQTLFSASMSGFLGELEGGAIGAVVGIEMRKDEIASIPDDVARDGLFFGFFADGGAQGDKTTKEIYAEFELPLLANRTLAKELTINLAGRKTKDEFYDASSTWSAKMTYRPIESLLLRATQGTSYRAPNVRENFLLAQTGFNNVFDPCAIPANAFSGIPPVYDPSLDTREAEVLANCAANGIDPTTLDLGGFNTYSVEVARGGTANLTEEKSETYTYGFSWEQPFTNKFDLDIGATYYQIDINDTIIEPSAQFIVNDCYFDLQGDSSFCNRIQRDPSTGQIDLVAANYINRDNSQARGVDVNINYSQNITIADYPIEIGIDMRATHIKEASDTFLDDDGNPNYDDDAGEFGFPKWRGNIRFTAEWDKFLFSWNMDYLGKVEQDPLGIDEFDDISGNSDTCLGPSQGDVLCRDVGFADDYTMHTASLYYNEDDWMVGFGIRNVFDDEPPQVDGSEVFSRNNTPIGVGYDLNGRTYFLDFGYKF